jgi:hypothetical protein
VIDLDNGFDMLMRLPADRDKSFDYHGAFFRPSATAAYVLGNEKAQFRFLSDDISGLRLDAISTPNGIWRNNEFELWRAVIFDTVGNKTTSTSMFHPIAEKLTSIESTQTMLRATWSNLKVGGIDALNAILTITFDGSTDWINASLSVAWVGTATRFAIDSLCVLPLRIGPRHRGSDYACFPAVFGILSKDPITKLRYDRSVGGTLGGFHGLYRNVAMYPSGRGWTMGVWGYYETVDGTGWMVWNERFDLTVFSACFQSDGQNMLFEAYVPQEDNILVSNNGRTIEATGFCVRPFLCTNGHGWWDVAAFYKERLTELQPGFYQPLRTARDDLSAYEKGPFVFLDLALSGYTGSTTYLPTLIGQMRTGLGIGPDTPVLGIGSLPACNLTTPFEAEIGDARATFATLFSQNIFVGKWEPAAIDNSFGQGPGWWSKYVWSGNEKRWWQNTDPIGGFHMSRSGYLAGGGVDRLSEATGTPPYYRERTYTVTNWNAGTKTATVSGTPSADGFGTRDLYAALVPASGAVMANAAVTSLGANSVVLTTVFTDGQGATATPVNGDTLAVFTLGAGNASVLCPHAQINSAAWKANIEENVMNGRFKQAHVCATYWDTYDEPQMVTPFEQYITCHRDHSSWSQIDAGYVRHPYGGGNWFMTAKNAYFKALKDSVHATQLANGNVQAYLMNCEDVNETTARFFDFCWHVIASGELWRSENGIDPTLDGYKAIPFFAVVHAGRVFGRAQNQELSSAALINSSPYNTVALHRTMAYWLASEWCYGLTLPTLSLFADDVLGSSALNLWDETLYVSGGGSVSDEVRQIRDLWVQMMQAEIGWIQEYLRYGDMLTPIDLDFESTDWTTGYADTTYTNQYHSYDVIYDRSQYPKVTHAVWRSRQDGSCLVVLTNWTQSICSFGGRIAMQSLQTGGRVYTFNASMLDFDGSEDQDTVLDFDPDTGDVLVQNIPAYSLKAIMLARVADLSNLSLIATWRPGAKRVGQVQEGF